MQNLPYLEWVHSVTAGIDHIVCPELMSDGILLTNAKGKRRQPEKRGKEHKQ